jgi:hypothetical protein
LFLGDSVVLINRRADGTLEIRDDLIFHGGTGATLEMREFGITSLKSKLLDSGFRDVHLLTENIPSYGIIFDENVSQPLIARKERFVMSGCGVHQLVDQIQHLSSEAEALRAESAGLREQIRMAAKSRWVKLGRKLGVGPDFEVGKKP